TDTAEHWANIAKRMAQVPETLAGYRASLSHSADKGLVAAVRQVRTTAEQCDVWSGANGGDGVFPTLAPGARRGDGAPLTELEAAARAANQAYADLAAYLRTELAPKAPEEDAVGADAYRLWSRVYLGAEIDQAEAYEWGWAEFARIEAEMKEVADRI